MLGLLGQFTGANATPDTIALGWDKIIMALIGLLAPLIAALVWVVKRAMAQTVDQQQKATKQNVALLEMMDRHHDDREARAKEQHEEHLRNHEVVLKAIAESQAAMLGAFRELMAEVGARRENDKGMHDMLFRMASVISFQKAKEWGCPEVFMALLDFVVKGDADSARREFAHGHAPNKV
jgi:flagellar biogenesis protein FliO